MTPTPHTLSIISVAFNEEPHIARLKKAFDTLHPVDGVTIETILVDGGSRDGTVRAAQATGFDQVLFHSDASIPVCRNIGARAATGDWLAYVDADCEVSPDWLEQAAPYLSRDIPVVIGWPVVPPDSGTWVQRAWHVHWSCKNRAAQNAGEEDVISEQAFRLLTTRNLLLNREIFDALEGFDEDLPTGEDTDFVFRATGQGLTVLGVPTLHVVHHGEPATLREFYRQQLWHANRTSYRPELFSVGGHAPLFAALFLILGLFATAGLIAATLYQTWRPLLALIPWLGLVTGPAFVIARRAGKLGYILPLGVIYAAYGLARAIDLAGFHRAKTSWKNP